MNPLQIESLAFFLQRLSLSFFFLQHQLQQDAGRVLWVVGFILHLCVTTIYLSAICRHETEEAAERPESSGEWLNPSAFPPTVGIAVFAACSTFIGTYHA